MHISLTRRVTDDRAVTLAVSGEVDLLTVPQLTAAIQQELLTQHRTELIIDLKRVTFLDCAGIGALVTGRNTAIRQGRPYTITNPQPPVRTLLHLTGVLTALTECQRRTPPTDASTRVRLRARNSDAGTRWHPVLGSKTLAARLPTVPD